MSHILLQKLGFKQRPIRSNDMPQEFLHAPDASLRIAARDLDNYLPPSQNLQLLKWRGAINSIGVNDPPTPLGPAPPRADFSHLKHLEKPNDICGRAEGGEDTSHLRREVATTQDVLSEVDLVTWKHMTRPSAYLDYLVLRLNDEVIDCQLDSQYGGFMYYDNQATGLEEVIESRGVYVAFNDAVTQVHSFFLKHGVRIYQEVKTSNGLRFKYLGDYFIHRTQKTLSHVDWALLSEEVKEKIVKRYVDKGLTESDDPCPGSKFSPINVRRWYDKHDILPLVVLYPTGRTLSEPTQPSLPFEANVTKRTAQPQLDSFMNMDGSSCSADERSSIATSDIGEQILEYVTASGIDPLIPKDEPDAMSDHTSLDIASCDTRSYDEVDFASRHTYAAKILNDILCDNEESYKTIRQRLFELSGHRTRTGWEYSKILQALDDITFGQMTDAASSGEKEGERGLFSIQNGSIQKNTMEVYDECTNLGNTNQSLYPAPNGPPPPGYF